jgi:hypothetical protein
MAERSLREVQQRHPGFDVVEVFGGYMAVTRGASILRASFLEALDEKLTAEEAASERKD